MRVIIESEEFLISEHMSKAPLATSMDITITGVNNVRRVRVVEASKIDSQDKFLSEILDLLDNLEIGNYNLLIKWEFIDELLSMYETTIKILGGKRGC